MQKKPLTRRDYAVIAVVFVLFLINPFDRKWFEFQGLGLFAAMVFSALVSGAIFALSMWIFGYYRQPKS